MKKDDGAYGSVRDYYEKVSYGQLQLQCDVLGPYTAVRNMSYYGANSGRDGNDINPTALFIEAINFAIKDVSLSDYDSDKDGYVDNIHIIFAGYGEEAGATSNAIWSHEATFSPISIGGMFIDRYSCSPELRGNSGNGITRIGPPCHEMGHALGAMDYYDTDYQKNGQYEGTGQWDVMASGSWNDDGIRPADFNPYVKAYDFGWVEVQTLSLDTVNVIGPSTLPNKIYRIDTPVTGDFFMLDNRQSEGINETEPAKGLLIFHIGPQMLQKAQTNTINAAYPQQCYVVCASAKERRPRSAASSYGSISSSGCPYPGSTNNMAFTESTTPAACTISGQSAHFSLTDITLLPNGNISLFYNNNANNDDRPEEPDTPSEDELEGQMVWSDDFEIAQHFRTQTWTNENTLGRGEWTIKTHSETSSEKEAKPVSGNCYMVMEATHDNDMLGNKQRFSCRTISSPIQTASGEYFLAGNYTGYSTKKLSNDSLVIEIKIPESESWISIKSFHIMKPLEWQSFTIPISCNRDGNIQIAFSGIADDTSLIYIDNLRLYKQIENKIEIISENRNSPIYVYGLDGTYVGKYRDEGVIQPGLYIIRQGERTCKIFIR